MARDSAQKLETLDGGGEPPSFEDPHRKELGNLKVIQGEPDFMKRNFARLRSKLSRLFQSLETPQKKKHIVPSHACVFVETKDPIAQARITALRNW